MGVDVCAVVLAAGEGRRLRPLTEVLPKALCPVGNVTLLDRALARVGALGFSGPVRVAVNACYLAEQVVTQVGGRVRVSVEPGAPLGTSGGLANLKGWIAGRGTLVGNADGYLADGVPPGYDIAALLDGWDGETVRLLGTPAPGGRGEFGRYNFAGFSLLPWSLVAGLPVAPTDLVSTIWRPAERAGRLTVVEYPGAYFDSGTPSDYLAANLHAAAQDPSADATGSLVDATAAVSGHLERAIVGDAAQVRGTVTRTVVWPGGYVGPHEHLVDAVRVGRDLTVHCVDTMG